MTPYERGFSAGEQRAWQDRHQGDRRIPPTCPGGDYERGFWDGYMPRNPSWAVVRRVVTA